MANFSGLHLLSLSFIIATGALLAVSGTDVTIVNSCGFTVWPGILNGNGTQINDAGFTIGRGSSVGLTVPAGWSGRIWARTGCKFDGSGAGRCLTGDCGNKFSCAGSGGVPPVTLAEFTIGKGGAKDLYAVSLVHGYNVQMRITTQGGSGDCQNVGCVADLNRTCPKSLRVRRSGNVVACKSACEAFGKPEYCCTVRLVHRRLVRRRITGGYLKQLALKRIATHTTTLRALLLVPMLITPSFYVPNRYKYRTMDLSLLLSTCITTESIAESNTAEQVATESWVLSQVKADVTFKVTRIIAVCFVAARTRRDIRHDSTKPNLPSSLTPK